jgi:hypothetical protein
VAYFWNQHKNRSILNLYIFSLVNIVCTCCELYMHEHVNYSISMQSIDYQIDHNLTNLHTIYFMATICRNCQCISVSSKVTNKHIDCTQLYAFLCISKSPINKYTYVASSCNPTFYGFSCERDLSSHAWLWESYHSHSRVHIFTTLIPY